MIRLVEEAQNQKADVQRLADRVSGVFVPIVIALTLATLAAWLLLGGRPGAAINAALSVLVIACPCSLGLATPTALFVASGEGARRGIFFKGYQGLEASRDVDTIVLDKTGTVTTGRMALVGVEVAEGLAVVSGSGIGRPEGWQTNADVGNTVSLRATFVRKPKLLKPSAVVCLDVGQAHERTAALALAAVRADEADAGPGGDQHLRH